MTRFTVQIDADQFRQLNVRLGRIEKLLKAMTGEEEAEQCPRCGDEKLCADCKVVVEEVPA